MIKSDLVEAAWNGAHDMLVSGYGSFYFDNDLDESNFNEAIFEAAVKALIEALIDSGEIFDSWNNKTVHGGIILYDSYCDRMTVIDDDTLKRFNTFYHLALNVVTSVLIEEEEDGVTA